MTITQEKLKEMVHYAPETGIFTLVKPKVSRIAPGQRAGWRDSHGYRRIELDGQRFREHRLAWFLSYGVWPREIDHINRIRDDNRIENLREASHSENLRNTGPKNNNKCGFKGVCWNKRIGKWVAAIKVDGRPKHLGLFGTAEEASAAYECAANRLYGEFVRASNG